MLDPVQQLLQSDSLSNDQASLHQCSLHGPKTEDSPLGIKEITIIKQPRFTSGHSANVYKCTRKSDTGSDEVAIKSSWAATLNELNEFVVARVNKDIDREVKIWAGLEHQYVLPFYGTVEGFGPIRALVSPWMPNENLNSYLNRADVSLTEMDRLRLLIQITEGLKYLHDNDIVHRDLTSKNVLIAADGSPRLADFGISNNFRQSDLEFSFHLGEVGWIAPECMSITYEETLQEEILLLEKETLLSKKTTLLRNINSVDIYSLGCIILEVLYGTVPYWWMKNATHVFSAKLRKMKPIQVGFSFQIQHNHLDIMMQCWSDEREARPPVDEVFNFLHEELKLASPLRMKLDVTNVKSILDADATRRRTKLDVPRSIPQGFFDNPSTTPTNPPPSTAHADLPPSTDQIDPPPSTIQVDPLSSSHHRRHALVTFLSRTRIGRVLARFRHSQPNDNESMDLQQHTSQTGISVHEPAHTQIPVVQDNEMYLAPARFLSWLRNNTPGRPTFPPWTRLGFFNRPQRRDDEGMELWAGPPVVDVPLANGLLRVANEDGVRRTKEEKERKKEEEEEEEEEEGKGKQAKIVQNAKKAATTSQRHTRNNITQQSAGPSQANPSSQLQAAVLTSPTIRAAGATPPLATSSTPHTDAIILRTGCCTPFFICIGCRLAQHSDGHH